ncbi:MAG: DNA repair protein RecO [Rhodospirillaceae bacterium]|nr:DNA repair protein RecO [Rhodospirillaceae bacterium]
MAVEWTDLGLVLSVRKHGEYDLILHVLTQQHGHYAGVVKGGIGRRTRGLYQPGNRLQFRWRARLEDHLGTFVCEPDRMFAAAALHDRLMLTALSTLCASAEAVLPEREAHPLAYHQACHLLENLGDPNWVSDYVLWEMHLLNELGFGLDLTSCASTGVTEELIYVSPKSGRAVCRKAGEPYRTKLLSLPAFLKGEYIKPLNKDDVIFGLDLTGFFLERYVYGPHGKSLPSARQRLRALVAG